MAFTRGKQKLSHYGIVTVLLFSPVIEKKMRWGMARRGGSFCHILPDLRQISVLIKLFRKGNMNYMSYTVDQKMEHTLLRLFYYL